MSEKLEDIPESEEEIAFRGFVGLLKADETLDRVVHTWIAWDGETRDTNWPSSGELPWIRLTPQTSESRRLTAEHWDTKMSILVETCVPGLDASKRMRLWAAIRRAINAAFRASMAPYGVRDVRIARPTFGVDSIADNALVISEGTIELLLTAKS